MFENTSHFKVIKFKLFYGSFLIFLLLFGTYIVKFQTIFYRDLFNDFRYKNEIRILFNHVRKRVLNR